MMPLKNAHRYRDSVQQKFNIKDTQIENLRKDNDELCSRAALYRDDFNRLSQDFGLLKEHLKVAIENVPAKTATSIPSYRRVVPLKQNKRHVS